MTRRLLRPALFVAWIIFATLALGRLWLVFPQTFPPLPQSVWALFERWASPECCEEAADLEVLVVLITAVLVVIAATSLGWLIWRRLRRA